MVVGQPAAFPIFLFRGAVYHNDILRWAESVGLRVIFDADGLTVMDNNQPWGRIMVDVTDYEASPPPTLDPPPECLLRPITLPTPEDLDFELELQRNGLSCGISHAPEGGQAAL